MIYMDTHIVVWLYAEAESGRLSAHAREAVRAASEIRISPMVRLELQFLYEIDRLGATPATIVDELTGVLGIRICNASFDAVVRRAESQGWMRDPFDRLIVAQAALHEAPLVTKDGTIREHYQHAVW